MQNVDISAAMDPNEEAQKYAKSKGVKLVFKTYKELLNVHEIKALIIPGGESTVISKMLVENNFISYLRDFSQKF